MQGAEGGGIVAIQGVETGLRVVAQLRSQRRPQRLGEVGPGVEHEPQPLVADDVGGRGHPVRSGDQPVRDGGQGGHRRGVDAFGKVGHAGTCCSKRVSTMWSAARSAIATIVDVGFTPDEVTKHEPSTTYRFGTS